MSDTAVTIFSSVVLTVVLAPRLIFYYSREVNDASAQFKKVSTLSAPGKALIAGGYLVLEHPNLGVTVSTSSRFYTSVRLLRAESYVSPKASNLLKIRVLSPQFYTQYDYSYNPDTNKIDSSGEGNIFVEKCLALTLAFIKACYVKGDVYEPNNYVNLIRTIAATHSLEITLKADNDFYSQIKNLQRAGQPLLSSSLAKLPKFSPCPKDGQGNVEIAKTGLGSSAALTTSLIGALLQWFNVTRVGLHADTDDRRIIHNLAQLAHANAQGKIGSGFDVAAAAYGTLMYRRFNSAGFDACLSDNVTPDIIHSAVMATSAAVSIPTSASVNALQDKRLMEETQQGQRSGGNSAVDAVLSSPPLTAVWGQTIRPFSLPYGMNIVLGDVCGGSSSTSMARAVLRWKRDYGENAENLWNALGVTNTAVFAGLELLNSLYQKNPTSFNAHLAWASERSVAAWEEERQNEAVVMELLALRGHLQTARQLLKQMGQQAGVGIEPDEQTALADATMALPGVLSAGVPGAGGADALFALTLSDAARGRVEALWSEWHLKEGRVSGSVVCPLLLEAGRGLYSGVVAHLGTNETI